MTIESTHGYEPRTNFATLGEAWVGTMSRVLTHGRLVQDGPEYLKEVLSYTCSIDELSASDPILTVSADLERIRFMQEKYSYCGVLPPYKISYGGLLYNNHNVNQISWATDRLQRKLESKSATIGLHEPGVDDLSCLSLLDYKVRTNSLLCHAVYRSQNVFSSQPGNLLALRHIQEGIADDLGVNVGPFCLTALSAHIYSHDLAAAREVVVSHAS